MLELVLVDGGDGGGGDGAVASTDVFVCLNRDNLFCVFLVLFPYFGQQEKNILFLFMVAASGFSCVVNVVSYL